MQASSNTIRPEDGSSDVQPENTPHPILREDVDEQGNPVIYEADPEEIIPGDTKNPGLKQPEDGSSGAEEKDITD